MLLGALCAEPAGAGGIGGSFTYGRSEGRLEDRDDVWTDLDTETDVAGFGLGAGLRALPPPLRIFFSRRPIHLAASSVLLP